jgi:hypothetical protein
MNSLITSSSVLPWIGIIIVSIIAGCSSPSFSQATLSPAPSTSLIKEHSDRFELHSFKDADQTKSDLLKNIDPSLVAPHEQLKLELVRTEKKSPNGNCLLVTTDAQLTGLKNYKIQSQINAQLASFPQRSNAHFEKWLHPGDYCTTRPFDTVHYGVWLDRCRVEFATRSLLSLACNEGYFRGPYPVIVSRTLTVSLRSGKIYRYSDLLRPGINAAQQIGQRMAQRNVPKTADMFKREVMGFSHPNASFYLSTDCQYFRDENEPIDKVNPCLVIPTMQMSGVWRGKKFFMPIQEIQDLLSRDPEVQELIMGNDD